MENIVLGIKRLKIHNATVENQILIENRQLPNVIPWPELPTNMNPTTLFTMPTDDPQSLNEKEIPNEDSDDSKNGNEVDASFSRIGLHGVCRRQMPSRASKDHLKLLRTSITKPKKRATNVFKICRNLSDLRRVYMERQTTKFNPTNLETIFEEGDEDGERDNTEINDIRSQVRVVKIGNKKLKRSISFGDGQNTTKAIIKKRRLKIKKSFGSKVPSIKKISFGEFHDRLSKSFESASMGDNEGKEIDDDGIESSNKQQESTTSPSAKSPNVEDMQMDVVIAKLNTYNCDRADDDADSDDTENASMY